MNHLLISIKIEKMGKEKKSLVIQIFYEKCFMKKVPTHIEAKIIIIIIIIMHHRFRVRENNKEKIIRLNMLSYLNSSRKNNQMKHQ